MNYYLEMLAEVRSSCFSNQVQIDLAVSTKRYLDTYYDRNIHLNILAHNQCTSKYHLIRIFKKYYGITPHQYLIDKRIEQAKSLLRSGSSVSETCYAVGFESVHSFSTLFKGKTGLSPSAYK